MSGMQSLIGFFLGNARPSSQDTVVHVKRTVLAVAWLAINQSVRTIGFIGFMLMLISCAAKLSGSRPAFETSKVLVWT